MEGQNRVVLQGPTGFGKTVVMADIVERARAKGRKVLVTVPAISLVDQTVEAFFAQGIREIGVIQAQHEMTDFSRPVQVASVQTLSNRWREGKMPAADVVLVDEVHRWFKLFENWLEDAAWKTVPVIGFSATPWRRGLGAWFRKLICAANIDDLIARKVLVPYRTFAPDAPDLSGVRVVGGEFVEGDLDEVMRPKKLVANIVETWRQLASDRPTVCFCCSRAHAEQVADEFDKAGVGAGYMDCETPASERREVRRRMLTGEVQVVVNVDVVGIGVDWPEVSCVVYARPTMSDIRFVQNIGRGLRSAEGKSDLLILDHSTTTARLGFVSEVYALHGALDDGRSKAKGEQAMALPKECPACHYLKPPRVAACPNCGHKVEAHAKPVLVERGTLRELKPGDDMEGLRKVLPDKAHVFGQLWWWALHKGYKSGFAAVKTKEIFGSFPRAREPEPDTIGQPVPELVAYLYDSTQKWKRRQDYAKRSAQRKQAQGSAAASGALVGQRGDFVDGTLCTEEDLEEFR